MSNGATNLLDGAIGLGILVAIGGFLFVAARTAQAATAISNAVETKPEQNTIARIADAATDLFAGSDPDLSPGDRVFRFFNPDDAGSLCRAGQTQFCTSQETIPLDVGGASPRLTEEIQSRVRIQQTFPGGGGGGGGF